jgi:hypothetical protein
MTNFDYLPFLQTGKLISERIWGKIRTINFFLAFFFQNEQKCQAHLTKEFSLYPGPTTEDTGSNPRLFKPIKLQD